MAWYRAGTVAVTNGSASVTGAGTQFVDNLSIGAAFHGPDGRTYEVTGITSATVMTITPTYQGSTASGQAYSVQPNAALLADFRSQVVALLSLQQGFIDGPLAGLWDNGTVALPPIAFAGDPNTGVRWIAADRLGLVGGGVDLLDIFNGVASGAAVRTTRADTSVTKLLTAAAIAWGSTATLDLPTSNDMDAVRMSGLWRFDLSTVGAPTAGAAGVVLHMVRATGMGNGAHFQTGIDSNGGVKFRRMTDGAGAWSAWLLIQVGPTLNLDGAIEGGAQVTIADDAAATVTLPRKGGWVAITAGGNGASPVEANSVIAWVDAGSTLAITKVIGGSNVDVVVTDLTGTTGVDGKLTVAARTDVIKIENRTGGALTLQVRQI